MTTNSEGLAWTEPLIANGEGGNWVARATVAGVGGAAVFDLTNLRAPTAVDLSSSANPSVGSEKVQFRALIRGQGPPNGEVQFKLDGADLGEPVVIDDARAAAAPVALAPGAHQIEAVYPGNAGFEPSGGHLTQQVSKAATGVKLASTANPSALGEAIALTATVAGEQGATATPTGTVRFRVGGADRGPPVALINGVATLAGVSDLAVGEHGIEALYGGDPDFDAGTGSMHQAVGSDRTGTEVEVAPNPAAYGEPIALIAKVKSSTEVPTGSVTLGVEGGPSCGALLLDPTGKAQCTLDAPLPPGPHTVIAGYAGNTDFQPSGGSSGLQVVPARTEATVSSEPEPSAYGRPIALSADVDVVEPGAGTATGTVQFRVDGSAVGGPVGLDEGHAAGPALSTLAPGLHHIEVEYAGEEDFKPTSDETVATVVPATVKAAVTASVNPATAGEPVTLTARVQTVAGPTGPPPGLVQFTVDGRDRGAPVPLTNGVATSGPVAGLAPGSHEVRANYEGGTDFHPSEADFALFVVQPKPGSPGPTASAAPEPQALVASRHEQVSSDGTVTIELVCAGSTGRYCQGTLGLAGHGRAALGKAGFSVPSGEVSPVRVRLSKAGKRALSRTARVRASAELTPDPGTGGSSGSVLLTAPRAPALMVVGPGSLRAAAGRVPVAVLCRAPAAGRCSGEVTMFGPGKRKIDQRAVTVRGQRRSSVALTLDSAARRLLAAGRLVVRVEAYSGIPVGLGQERTRTLVVEPPSPAGRSGH